MSLRVTSFPRHIGSAPASSSVAIYVRVSTEEQRERQSIATQQEFAAKYCDLHGLDASQVYSDNGVSGTIPVEKRPAGQQILADARQGKFSQILIYKLDRLGRDSRMILNSVHELEDLGVRVRSMTEDFDTGTAAGRLMLTLLSGFAAHEREMIRERSVAGTKRLAHAGAWLGGIVPYGYRKEGERREARLVIADALPPEIGVSEADVIRIIYRMAAVDGVSCRAIAEHLNAMRVPCAYIRDDRLLLKGKRRQRTCGLWRAGRIRNLITSTTYKGLHQYGKRTQSRDKELIARQVPPIVTEEIWTKAQGTLAANFLFGARNAKNQYLLRGLMKCTSCHLTFIGTSIKRPSGKLEFYYRCNGKHSARQIFGAHAKRCGSKDINGTQLESLVWSDVERFLSHPSEVLGLIADRLSSPAHDAPVLHRNPEQISSALLDKQQERDRILALYRRGRIDEDSLEKQLKDIEAEEKILRQQRAECMEARETAQSITQTVTDVDDLLRQLRARLDQGISWDLKRKLVETLVDGVEIETTQNGNRREAVVNVRYRFAGVSSDCTGRGSWRQPASSALER